MSINREERRALKKKIAPIARKIAAYENLIVKDPSRRGECEALIEAEMEKLTILEMMALEDYIASKKLLNNFDSNNNK